MAEVLSQAEIDKLLAALTSGEMSADALKGEEARVRIYDFKRALRMSKEQIRSLIRINEGYARLLSSYFSARLRAFVDVKLETVEQLPYEEFIRSIPSQTLLFVFQAEPLQGRMVLEVPTNISYAMLDRLLGGQGFGKQITFNFTEIDRLLLERLITQSFDQLREAWADITKLTPRLDTIEYSPQFLQLVSANETVVVSAFSVVLGDVKGFINLCIPHIALEPVIGRLSSHYFLAQQQRFREESDKEPIRKHLLKTEVEVIVELGRVALTVRELLSIRPGDVITLDQSIHKPLRVKVDGEVKFLGNPGTVNQRLGVQIVDLMRSGGNEHE